MPESILLQPNGWVPNNAVCPVLLYRDVEDGGCEAVAEAFEKRFAQNHWPPRWRDTVFDYHHYHSTAHEALGVAGGTATLMLGGPGGQEVVVSTGDALILPVGTGHCRLYASADFLMVGAYPEGQDWDIRRDAPSGEDLQRMAHLAIPQSDPVQGKSGGVQRYWSRQN